MCSAVICNHENSFKACVYWGIYPRRPFKGNTLIGSNELLIGKLDFFFDSTEKVLEIIMVDLDEYKVFMYIYVYT